MTAKEIRRLDINFRDPNATYRAGDVITGSINLDLGAEFKVKGIKLYLNGIARVQWDEKRAYTKGSASKLSHKNMDVYLDESLIIMRKTNGNMAPGPYNWPFTIRLPPYLPASFEGQWGQVQYWAKLVLDRPWKGDITFTKNFIVQGAFDLNTDPEAKKPVDGVGELMAGTFCCKTGPITGQLSLQRKGYTPGEDLPFSAKIQNDSKKKLSVRVVLAQQVTFRADKEVRRTNTLLKGLTKGELSPRQSLEWEDEIKVIPPIVPTKLGGGCKNIEVKYVLKLIAIPSGMGSDLEVPVEVIMGTVPLRKMESGSPKLTVKAAAREGGSPYIGRAGQRPSTSGPSGRRVSEVAGGRRVSAAPKAAEPGQQRKTSQPAPPTIKIIEESPDLQRISEK